MKETFNPSPEAEERSPKELIQELRDKIQVRTTMLVSCGLILATTFGLFKYLHDDKKEKIEKDTEEIKTILKHTRIVHNPPKDVVLPKETTPEMSRHVVDAQSHIPETTYEVEEYNDLSDKDAQRIEEILHDIEMTVGVESTGQEK